MAASDEEDRRNYDSDHGGQGEQEGGGAKPRKQPRLLKKVLKPPCCDFQGKQLSLVQRKMILIVSMMYVVIPDGNHRNKDGSYSFMYTLWERLVALRGPFDYKQIRTEFKLPARKAIAVALCSPATATATEIDNVEDKRELTFNLTGTHISYLFIN